MLNTIAIDAEACDAAPAVDRVDLAVTSAMAPVRDHPVTKAAATFGELGDQPPLTVLSVGLLVTGLALRRPRLARAGGRMLASFLLATFAKNQIKHRVDRTRPFVVADKGRYERGPGVRRDKSFSSFPSGHTAGALAVAQALSREYPGLAMPARLTAAAIALVQIPRCAHYPSDVAAGAAIGIVAEALVDRAFSRL